MGGIFSKLFWDSDVVADVLEEKLYLTVCGDIFEHVALGIVWATVLVVGYSDIVITEVAKCFENLDFYVGKENLFVNGDLFEGCMWGDSVVDNLKNLGEVTCKLFVKHIGFEFIVF